MEPTLNVKAKRILDETIGYAQYALTINERERLMNRIAQSLEEADKLRQELEDLREGGETTSKS